MKLIVRTWFTAYVAMLTVTTAQITWAQSIISDHDVARLKAFIGDNDFDAKPPSGLGASVYSSSGGSVVNGVYKIRPGDTLSEIMAVHLGDTGVNFQVSGFLLFRPVDSGYAIEHVPTHVAGDAIGVGKVKHGVAGGAELHSLVLGG